jgi:hypothetical protein
LLLVRARMLGLTAILALWCALSAASALADGDPASDVLATQSLFLPQDANVGVGQQAQLVALVNAAARSGYPIRVALISSAADLGSITELWRQPQNYARFLGQELSLVYHGPLLIVMPNGFGLYGFGGSVEARRAALGSLGAGAGPTGIGQVAASAIERLAADSGHPLPTTAAAAPTASRAGDPRAWIALAIGALLIVAAWGASLRARPLRGAPRTE